MDQDQLDQAITFIWMIWRFWWLRGHVAEHALHWQTFMAKRREMAPHECALALSGTGFTFIADGDQDQARSAFEQSLPLFREAGDLLGGALAAAALGHVLASQHDDERAGEVLEQAMNLLREAGTGERTEQERVQYLLVLALVNKQPGPGRPGRRRWTAQAGAVAGGRSRRRASRRLLPRGAGRRSAAAGRPAARCPAAGSRGCAAAGQRQRVAARIRAACPA
jgi:tetratricopeptide (TPR) repeat protein